MTNVCRSAKKSLHDSRRVSRGWSKLVEGKDSSTTQDCGCPPGKHKGRE